MTKLTRLMAALSLAALAAGPALAQDPVKIGFITKFPVPFFATMEDAAKAYAAANPGVEITFGQGASATDIRTGRWRCSSRSPGTSSWDARSPDPSVFCVSESSARKPPD